MRVKRPTRGQTDTHTRVTLEDGKKFGRLILPFFSSSSNDSGVFLGIIDGTNVGLKAIEHSQLAEITVSATLAAMVTRANLQ